MTGTKSIPIDTAAMPAIEQPGLTELIRGNEQKMLAQLTPLVRRRSVTLDLGRVERIDAAGISALLSLYVSAREAGRCFTVVNLSPHVAEILTLVGVKLVLESHIVATNSQSGTRFKDSSQRKCLSGRKFPAL